YSVGERLTPLNYRARLERLGIGLVRHLGGALYQRPNGDLTQYLLDAGLWPISVLATIGVIWQWRKGNPLPGLLLAGVALILPLFSRSVAPGMNARYLAPLLPVLFAGVGALWDVSLSSRRPANGRRARRSAA